jgi:hypothetical protein
VEDFIPYCIENETIAERKNPVLPIQKELPKKSFTRDLERAG